MIEPPNAPLPNAPLPVALGQLEACVSAVGADSEAPPARRARALAAIESDLCLALAEHASAPDLAGLRGHPVMAAMEAWGDDARQLAEPEAATAAEQLVERLVADEGERWQRTATALLDRTEGDEVQAARLFEHLLEATALEREALCRDRDHDDPTPVGTAREPVREALAAAKPSARQREQWVRALVDCADDVLTGVDDMPPARAAQHLRLVADDVAWHRRTIEPGRGVGKPLDRKLRRLRVEVQERQLQDALEDRFGARTVSRFERLVLLLIFVVVGILLVEALFDPPLAVQVALTAIDTLACGIFLTEFFVKLALVKGRGSWFLRHVLIDFIPSIPFGLLTLHDKLVAADQARWGRLLRLIRITRVARYLRVLLPLIRMMRAYGFLARGLDRLMRRYGELLNRNVILYPRREEREAARRLGEGAARRAARLRTRLDEAWRVLLRSAPPEERAAVLATRVDALAAARERGWLQRPARQDLVTVRTTVEVPAEAFFDRLESVTPEQLEAEYGQDFVARCARATRLFARPPIRWFPVLRHAVPRLAPGMTDAQITAAAAHALGRELRRHHDRVMALGDLHGTVTPAELVDRVGTVMFRASLRPARKLLLVGGVFLLLQGAAGVFGLDARGWAAWIESLIGDTLLLLGGICLLVLGIGWWLRSLAGRATAFYEQVAHAQYLALTEAIKGRYLTRDAEIFEQRVLAPESRVVPGAVTANGASRRELFLRVVRSWLVAPSSGADSGVSETLDRVVMLYRDSLDGALFVENDNRTTAQLLGDPALQEMRRLAWCFDRHDERQLLRLDLLRKRTFFGGPYLWFSFISKAVTQDVARLIVDYNRHAIPLAELRRSTPKEREAYERWKRGANDDLHGSKFHPRDVVYQTTAFKALHFLDVDPGRDAEVAAVYGEDVAAKLVADRQVLVREIFGTYPRHLRPKERRVANLYQLYNDWLQGGRGLFIPFRLLLLFLKSTWAAVLWIARAVGEIRRTEQRLHPEIAAHADFETAVRKIGRMRDPVVEACLMLRARMDPEYLGVSWPGPGGRRAVDHASEDLAFLGARPALQRAVDALRVGARTDMRRLTRLLDEGLLLRVAEHIGIPLEAFRGESLRALAIAYRGDYEGVKTLLSSGAVLDEALAGVLEQPLAAVVLWPRPRLKRMFKRWWAAHGTRRKDARRAFWRLAVHDVGVRSALEAWGMHGEADAAAEGTRRVADLLRHPRRISEQVVTLRAVQTLSLIDLLSYRTHVFQLGGYAASGDDPRERLTLLPVPEPTVG
ncbi:MAG: ion transporter [Planctomycetota bacterium]